jgi:hypothetical protein
MKKEYRIVQNVLGFYKSQYSFKLFWLFKIWLPISNDWLSAKSHCIEEIKMFKSNHKYKNVEYV